MAIENIGEIEQSLGLESGKLTEMLSSEENHKIDLSNRVIFSKDDYDARIDNIKKETSIASVEIAIKNARKDLGLEFEGKTMDNLLKAYGNKIEADSKVEPETKYKNLKTDFEKLQGNLTEWETKYNTLDSTYKKREQDRTINESLLKEIPDNTTIPKEDVLSILKARYEFNVGDNGIEILKNGQVEKNKSTLSPLTPNEFMKSFITPYLKKVEGGAGGDDSSGKGKETSFDLFEKEMADKGIAIGSQQFNIEMSKRISNKTLIM